MLLRLLLLALCLENALTYQYDTIVIGGGAGGLFAAGSSSGKTLLVTDAVGGDCTNAACVPSKALRSIVQTDPSKAYSHLQETVKAVREREKSSRQEFLQSRDGYFVDRHTFHVDGKNLTSRYFILATGAGPEMLFQNSSMPLWTYRDVLNADDDPFWQWLGESPRRLVIIGGGATACELGQSIGRLNRVKDLTLIAPCLLRGEDVEMQKSAQQLLSKAGVSCHLNATVLDVNDTGCRMSNGMSLDCDGVLVCTGRVPALASLRLENAGIAWDPVRGVLVHAASLQSKTCSNVYAIGDCCSVTPSNSRCASLAAWMGFHAVRNINIPRIFWRWGSLATHPTVPRVVYMEPELARVGWTEDECRERCPDYKSISIREEGSDRADMERNQRDTSVAFVTLRTSRSGCILGCTAVGPGAAEMANSVGMAITNGISVRGLARSIHHYPSHGYLLYRAALSLALSDTQGMLAICGRLGRVVGLLWGSIAKVLLLLRRCLYMKSADR